jgi:hydroxypyruvate reductase
MQVRDTLENIWWAGVRRVSGYESVAQALAGTGSGTFTHIAAVGKAASPMMRAALDANGTGTPALLVTKHGHAEPELEGDNLTIIESAHPVPDENSLRAGESLIDFVSGAGNDARLLLLVSGGASALAEALPSDMTLDDLQSINRRMLADGLDIHAINARRKEVSRIKSGKLLARFPGESAKVLLISDVEGDDISVIGSGIGEIPETRRHENFDAEIVASNAIARDACEREAIDQGLEVIVNTENLYGDVFDLAAELAKVVLPGAPGLYIFGGEPVTVLPENPGEGGRNQALAAAFAREIAGTPGIAALAAGTDGTDGPTGSAGGYVTGENWQATSGGDEALAAADSGNWLRRADGLFVTGPTGTNVMDIMLVLKSG